MKYAIHLLMLTNLVTSCKKIDGEGSAAGSWKIASGEIEQYDSLGNIISTKTFEDGGFLMLSYYTRLGSPISYGYSFDTTKMGQNSSMRIAFASSDGWNVTKGSQLFALSAIDVSTNSYYSTYDLTINELKHRKMELMIVGLHPTTAQMIYKETWHLKRATH